MSSIDKLLEIMAKLRDPDTGCPWDIEQDFQSIAPYTVEEAYEVADAIERGSLDELCDELGDLLLQVVFHAQMAREQDLFDFADVAAAISNKMIRRHPHVFADHDVGTAAEQTHAWEQHKLAERQQSGQYGGTVMEGVAANLPALSWAAKVGKRAARVGFDWPGVDGVLEKIREELEELQAARQSDDSQAVEEEFGDLLLAMTSLARHLEVDPETALRRANRKFIDRFAALEAGVQADQLEWPALTPEQLEQRWQTIKSSS